MNKLKKKADRQIAKVQVKGTGQKKKTKKRKKKRKREER